MVSTEVCELPTSRSNPVSALSVTAFYGSFAVMLQKLDSIDKATLFAGAWSKSKGVCEMPLWIIWPPLGRMRHRHNRNAL